MNNLQNLSLLNTGAGDLSFFYTLAQLEHLETLQLSDFEEPTSVLLPLVDGGALTYRPFPALKHLDINLPPAQLISLLKIFKQHPLQRLELRHYKHATPNGPDTSSYWAQVLRSVAGKFYSLKNLTMASTSAEVEDSFLSNNIYEPLLDMRGLESVNLDFPWPPFLDADFKKMASAWPELSTLRLAGLATAAPKATFAALEVLAMGCPKLHGLSLSFNACQLPSSDDTSVSCSKVKTLDAQHSPTDNALFTARHLDRLFPHLKTIQSTVQQKIWGEVGDLLRTFKAVRMDQKARDFQTMKRARPARRDLNATSAGRPQIVPIERYLAGVYVGAASIDIGVVRKERGQRDVSVRENGVTTIAFDDKVNCGTVLSLKAKTKGLRKKHSSVSLLFFVRENP
ncbi:hypothetical protein DXG01_015480 [Tephrocybe rancida]|nr:hypothetical protein DXG01_015480 [Tephrocybe rancida]